jgi:dolichol-phosphate mannosyltransferase
VRTVASGAVELAVGSRYVPGGGIEDWPLRRTVVSEVANWMTRPITPIRDATSGFFVIRRSALEGVTLDPIGFKIGLETFARARYRAYVEVPYTFTDRKYGASKFGLREIWLFLRQLGALYGERLSGRARRVERGSPTAPR